MNRLEPCAYCKSGYDHSSLGNCPRCGAPTEHIPPMYQLTVKEVTRERWLEVMHKYGFITPSERILMDEDGQANPIETTRSPFTTWR